MGFGFCGLLVVGYLFRLLVLVLRFVCVFVLFFVLGSNVVLLVLIDGWFGVVGLCLLLLKLYALLLLFICCLMLFACVLLLVLRLLYLGLLYCGAVLGCGFVVLLVLVFLNVLGFFCGFWVLLVNSVAIVYYFCSLYFVI